MLDSSPVYPVFAGSPSGAVVAGQPTIHPAEPGIFIAFSFRQVVGIWIKLPA